MLWIRRGFSTILNSFWSRLLSITLYLAKMYCCRLLIFSALLIVCLGLWSLGNWGSILPESTNVVYMLYVCYRLLIDFKSLSISGFIFWKLVAGAALFHCSEFRLTLWQVVQKGWTLLLLLWDEDMEALDWEYGKSCG